MRNSLKARSPDPSICPSCGKPNSCALAECDGELSSPDSFRCWCMAHPKVGLEEEGAYVACLCTQCLKRLVQNRENGEMAT